MTNDKGDSVCISYHFDPDSNHATDSEFLMNLACMREKLLLKTECRRMAFEGLVLFTNKIC